MVAQFRPEDWERAIRHGVKPDGRPLLVMPSEDYHRLTDADLSALVSYVRSLPPQAGGEARVEFPPPVWVLYGLGLIPDAAGRIDHHLPPAQPVAAGVNAAHGRYIANMCIGCHGNGLSGGKIPGGPPDWPPAANLTPGAGSAMVRYPDAARFVAMLRSGQRPDGSAIQVMPFESIGKLNDVDAQALYAYLQTVPPSPAGEPAAHCAPVWVISCDQTLVQHALEATKTRANVRPPPGHRHRQSARWRGVSPLRAPAQASG